MIKFLPTLYPDELLYSYLSRIYVRSGIGIHISFVKEILDKQTNYIDILFVNQLNEDFKNLIKSNLNFEDIMINHTLFKYYVCFYDEDKRNSLIKILLENKKSIKQFLPTKVSKNEKYYLRYCPECAKEDRDKYGEAYFHTCHQPIDIKVCSKHNCNLVDTNIVIRSDLQNSFVPLENCDINYEDKIINNNSFDLMYSNFISGIYKSDINQIRSIKIDKFLRANLNYKYLIGRGEKRNINLIYKDILTFGNKINFSDINTNVVSEILNGNMINNKYIYLVGLFEKISDKDIFNRIGKNEEKYEIVDKLVISLFNKGKNFAEISNIVGLDHSVISNIVGGKYNKENSKAKKVIKRSSEELDEQYCKAFNKVVVGYINQNSDIYITKKMILLLLGVTYNQLKRYPKLNDLINKCMEVIN